MAEAEPLDRAQASQDAKSVTRVKTVDIQYTASFGYSASASSCLKGELILVPPPERRMQVIRELP